MTTGGEMVRKAPQQSIAADTFTSDEQKPGYLTGGVIVYGNSFRLGPSREQFLPARLTDNLPCGGFKG